LPPTGHQAASGSSSSRRGAPGPALFEFDRALGVRFSVGADEAGRGCLAGPLVAAGVCFELARVSASDVEVLCRLNDSKRVKPEHRGELFEAVHAVASSVVLVIRPAEVIDRQGLHVTNIEALSRALEGAAPAGVVGEPGLMEVMSDGFAVPFRGGVSTKLVKGDTRSAAIAAASIVAKVTRDRYMAELGERWPEYGFAEHFGYATEVHRTAIRKHGPCLVHRMSFNSDAYNAPSST